MQLPTDEELQYIDTALKTFDDNLVTSMQHIRELQGLAPRDIAERFICEKPSNIYKYMQSSFDGVRPIHFAAAFSWITKTPATGFYLRSEIKESYRGMNDDAVAGLISIGSMPEQQFDIVINCIYLYLNDEGKRSVDQLRENLLSEFGNIGALETLYTAPDIIDLDKFSESYYRSSALTARGFRKRNSITQVDMARILGISLHRYQTIESVDHAVPFPLSIAIRLKLAFKLSSHVGFTSLMDDYSEFHQFRIAQHVRDMLTVEALLHVSNEQKPYVLEMIKGIANAYYKKA